MSQADEILQRLFGDANPEKVASQEPEGNASADYLKLASELEKMLGGKQPEEAGKETTKVASEAPANSEMNQLEKVAYLDVVREALIEAAAQIRSSHGK